MNRAWFIVIYVIICIIALSFMALVFLAIKEKDKANKLEEKKEPEDYSHSYQPRYLLTRNEWHEHKKLQKLAAERGLVVCPKVRLLDIIEPRKGEKNYKSLFYKVQAKHVDFLICDQAMHIKAVLELDDNSHNQKDRQDRDVFVDQILTSVGYKVIRTKSVTETTLDEISRLHKEPEV